MTSLDTALARIASTLDALDAAYALVGGLAVSARSDPRLTRDADLVVAVDDDEQAEAMIRRLVEHGYGSGMIVEQEQTGRLAAVRLEHPLDGGLVTDLLFASSGIEHEIVESAERLRLVGDLELPVATIGHLIALKLLARDDRQRPLDADDLRALSALATPTDWAQAEEAVVLIESRGYHRTRDLVAALRHLREHGPY